MYGELGLKYYLRFVYRFPSPTTGVRFWKVLLVSKTVTGKTKGLWEKWG